MWLMRLLNALLKPRLKGKPCGKLTPSDLRKYPWWAVDPSPEEGTQGERRWVRPLGLLESDSWLGRLLSTTIFRPLGQKDISWLGAMIGNLRDGTFEITEILILGGKRDRKNRPIRRGQQLRELLQRAGYTSSVRVLDFPQEGPVGPVVTLVGSAGLDDEYSSLRVENRVVLKSEQNRALRNRPDLKFLLPCSFESWIVMTGKLSYFQGEIHPET